MSLDSLLLLPAGLVIVFSFVVVALSYFKLRSINLNSHSFRVFPPLIKTEGCPVIFSSTNPPSAQHPPQHTTQPPTYSKPGEYRKFLTENYGIKILSSAVRISQRTNHERLIKLVRLLERFDLSYSETQYVDLYAFSTMAEEMLNIAVEWHRGPGNLKITVDGASYFLQNTAANTNKDNPYFVFSRNDGEPQPSNNVWRFIKA